VSKRDEKHGDGIEREARERKRERKRDI